MGDPAEGYYAGLPGMGYANILMEQWKEITPSGAYWNPTRILSDNRIPAMGSDTTSYIFPAPSDGRSNIRVTLLYRRPFKELMDLKGWDVPDIVMEEVVRTTPEKSRRQRLYAELDGCIGWIRVAKHGGVQHGGKVILSKDTGARCMLTKLLL